MTTVLPPPAGKNPACPKCGSTNTMIMKRRQWEVGTCVCLRCEHDWRASRTPTGIAPSLREPAPLLQSDNPSCVFCSGDRTDDVTPPQFPETDRLFLCQRCKRKFVVRFVPDRN